MKDLLLTPTGDLYLNENGDVTLTDSVSQAIRIRLQWFWAEWRFGPSFGIPYYEEIFIKSASELQTEQLFREQILSVEEVQNVTELTVTMDPQKRTLTVRFEVQVHQGMLREEVLLHV